MLRFRKTVKIVLNWYHSSSVRDGILRHPVPLGWYEYIYREEIYWNYGWEEILKLVRFCHFIRSYDFKIKLIMGGSSMIIIKAIAVYHLRYIPSNMYTRAALRFIVVWYRFILPSTRLASLAVNRADMWPSAGEATLNNMVQNTTWVHMHIPGGISDDGADNLSLSLHNLRKYVSKFHPTFKLELIV